MLIFVIVGWVLCGFATAAVAALVILHRKRSAPAGSSAPHRPSIRCDTAGLPVSPTETQPIQKASEVVDGEDTIDPPPRSQTLEEISPNSTGSYSAELYEPVDLEYINVDDPNRPDGTLPPHENLMYVNDVRHNFSSAGPGRLTSDEVAVDEYEMPHNFPALGSQAVYGKMQHRGTDGSQDGDAQYKSPVELPDKGLQTEAGAEPILQAGNCEDADTMDPPPQVKPPVAFIDISENNGAR